MFAGNRYNCTKDLLFSNHFLKGFGIITAGNFGFVLKQQISTAFATTADPRVGWLLAQIILDSGYKIQDNMTAN